MSDTTKISVPVETEMPPAPVSTTESVMRILAISAAVFGTVSLLVDTNIGFGFAVAGFLTGLFNRYAFGPRQVYTRLAGFGVGASIIGLIYGLLALNGIINEATINTLLHR